MKKLLLAALLLAGVAAAQTTVVQRPDCFVPLGLITSAPTNVPTGGFDNRTAACNTWVIVYTSFGFSVISLVVQTAPNVAGNIPGTWSTFTAVAGINPNTSIVSGSSTFGGSTGYFPWVRVRLASATGTGSITGALYGWKIPAGEISSVTACPGTIATPCVVIGPTAPGVVPTAAPVQISGQNGSTGVVERIQTLHGGYISIDGDPVTLSDGFNNQQLFPTCTGSTGCANLTFPMKFNGSSWDRDFKCTQKAVFNLSGSGSTIIIAASGSTVIRICHISFSTTAAEDFKLTTGTGAACGTGTADLTGLYKAAQSVALPFGPDGALVAPASAGVCLNQSAVQATGGVVIYAQF